MSFRQAVKKWGRALNRAIPKNRRQILLESNSDFCDNTRALYDYLVREGYASKYRFVWCVTDPRAFREKGMPSTKWVSFKKKEGFLLYFWRMARSYYVFYTHYVPPFCNARAQLVVNLWHGTPLKTLEGHVHPDSLFDFLLSPSNAFNPILAGSFHMSEDKLVQVGYPRCDLLFEESGALRRLGVDVSGYRKVLLWMPTFRRPADGQYTDAQVNPTGLPLLETDRELEALNGVLARQRLLLLIKLHPGQDMTGVSLKTLSHIRMLTNQELDEKGVQLYHLVGEADALLTDYSSIYFDYLLLNRPIGFIIDDIGDYRKNRGFVVEDPLPLMPGEKIRTVEELDAFLAMLARDQDGWEEGRQRVCRLANRFTDGNSSKRFAETFLPPN